MAEELRITSRPELERPVLIAAFRGWNDGAQAASLAAGYLAKNWDAEQFAEIDPENFFDFQATRPHVSLEEGLTRRIDWPETGFYHARPEGLDRDVVLLLGIEPNLRWRTFTDLVVGLARELGIELLITLGALLADVPHTRSAPVTGSASDSELVERLGLSASRYEGPTGIVGVLHDACGKSGHPVGEPLGGGAALRLADAEPARRARAVRAARGACSGSRSRPKSSRRRRGTTKSRSARPSPPTRRRPPTSRSSSGARTSSTTRPSSRQGTRSPPS